MQIYSETGMFVSKEEAIEQLSRCVRGSRTKSTGASNVKSRVFHGALDEVVFALVVEVKHGVDVPTVLECEGGSTNKVSLKKMVTWATH